MAEVLGRHGAISVIAVVDTLIAQAYVRRASDIHIDPTASDTRVRVRIDGALQEFCTLPRTIHSEILARIKVLGHLRTDEHFATQDGRFSYSAPNKDTIDIRISVAPTYHGENAVLRLLAPLCETNTLQSLGFSSANEARITAAVQKPHGMILSTGPTGCGKTTTLYTLLSLLNTPDVSVVTIEDPIEYAIAGVKQLQVHPKTGLTFAQGLRAILRQDPDTIMVGEIRDAETAHIAIHTALTGHLLLSTLHTNSAAATLPRLLDMGTDAYLVASTIELVIAQRLVRRLCQHCKVLQPCTSAMVHALSELPLHAPVTLDEHFFTASGCDVCNHTGYMGRICISEVLVANDAMRETLLTKASPQEIQNVAEASGMLPLIEDGFLKVRAGTTTVEEVLRAVHI